MYRWPVLRLLLLLLVLRSAAAAGAYSRHGEYLWFTDTQILGDFGYARIYLDGDVPIVDYGSHRSRNPATTAQYGLSRFGLFRRDGDRRALHDAVRAARWLVHRQKPDGSWRYDFPYRVGTLPEMPAGWPSALAQGQAISLLLRVHDVTRGREYLDAAIGAVRPLTRRVGRDGLQTRLRDGVWLEEYPTRPVHSFVLNGFMFALIGLYDVAPYAHAAARLYSAGRHTLGRVLSLFDAGDGCSLYALVHDPEGRVWRASPPYDPIHVGLLRALASISRQPVLRRFAERWKPGCA